MSSVDRVESVPLLYVEGGESLSSIKEIERDSRGGRLLVYKEVIVFGK